MYSNGLYKYTKSQNFGYIRRRTVAKNECTGFLWSSDVFLRGMAFLRLDFYVHEK